MTLFNCLRDMLVQPARHNVRLDGPTLTRRESQRGVQNDGTGRLETATGGDEEPKIKPVLGGNVDFRALAHKTPPNAAFP